ncbi:MAG: hypothetical protein VB111_10290 [Clostridiaceae bacterium]|nr:hypothetical protein [Clostridiaceae bacterium]
MAYRNDNSDTIPNKNLLDTCVSAFEIAIREIRKIENSPSAERWEEPIMLDKSTLDVMKAELVKCGIELYRTGNNNGMETLIRSEDDIARQINKTISDIIDSTIFGDRRL